MEPRPTEIRLIQTLVYDGQFRSRRLISLKQRGGGVPLFFLIFSCSFLFFRPLISSPYDYSSKVETRFMDTSLLRSVSLSLWKAFTFSLNSTPLRTRERGIRDTFFLFIQHGFSQKIDLAETEGKQTQVPGAGGGTPLYKPCRTTT